MSSHDQDAFELRLGERGYPSALEDLSAPPEVVYGLGDPTVLNEPSISVVGSRKASPYGVAVAEIAGRVAAESELVVVSGGALGCDAASARAALATGGRTVVVSGCGADRVYPTSSRDVFEAARKSGAVISIEAWGSPPRRYAFPKRNRVIAALSHATLVVEAGRRSGTMSTADAAAAMGRSLYAVPGSIFSPTSLGTNDLIANGASIICSEKDLETCIALDYDRLRLTSEEVPTVRGRILSALMASPTRPDELSYRLGENVVSVLGTLADYEARGMVVRLPDGRYSPSAELLSSSDRMGQAS